MAIFTEQSLQERKAASNAAKLEMLKKFKQRPAADSPEVIARNAERARIAKEREERAAARQAQKQAEAERLEREKAEAAAQAEAEANAARISKEENDQAMVNQLMDYEAQLKAKRDARYAARKARQR